MANKLIEELTDVGRPDVTDLYVIRRSGTSYKSVVNHSPSKLWRPSVTDGSSNMAAELEQFVSDNQGYVVTVPDDVTVLINEFGTQGNLDSTDDVLIDFGNATILYDEGERCINIDNSAAGTEVAVSSLADAEVNTNTYATVVTLSSTAGIETHDWVAIYSNDANPSKSGARLGEIHQAMSSESSLVFNLAGKMGRTSSFSSTIKCRKLDATRKLKITGGTFVGNGDVDDAAITDREECIRIIGFVEPEVSNVTFDGPWAQGLWFQACAAPQAWRIEMKNTLNMGSIGGFSYCVVLYGMNGNANIRDVTIRNGRHGITTDGATGSPTDWQNKGYPTYAQIISTSGFNCYGSVADTHEEGMYTTFDGITVTNSIQDENESFIGIAIQSRAAYDTFRNITMIGGTGIVKIVDVDHGFEDQVTIQNLYARDIRADSDNAKCINIESQGGTTNNRKVYLDRIDINTNGIGVFVGEECKLEVGDIRISGAEEAFETRGGCEVLITGKNVWDWFGIDNGSRVFKVRSNASYAVPKIIILQNPIVIKTSASSPAIFFEELDTATNKEVWHPGIIEYNPNAVTATVSKEAGSTTFVNSTAVSTITL